VPVEVPTNEELEKVVDEKLKKVLSDLQIMKRITELEFSIARLARDLNQLSAKEPKRFATDPLTTVLRKDLAQLADLLQIQGTADSVTLRPKTRLRDEDFRTVKETIIEHGGFWSSQRRTFIVPRNRTT
jgi:hypothetical protein